MVWRLDHAEQQQNIVKEVTKQRKYMCAFKNDQFTQLCIFGYKVAWMISQLFLPNSPSGITVGEKKNKKEGGDGNTNSLLGKTTTRI